MTAKVTLVGDYADDGYLRHDRDRRLTVERIGAKVWRVDDMLGWVDAMRLGAEGNIDLGCGVTFLPDDPAAVAAIFA